jgi:hypothetical protein
MKISKHPLFRRWTQVRYQILNQNAPQGHYSNNLPCVGLDDFWKFVDFVEAEIGSLPSPEYKLARKNQRRGWIPGNLYWARDVREVTGNLTSLIKLNVGRKKMTFREMSEVSGICNATLRTRIGRGWTGKDAVSIPAKLGQKIYGCTNLRTTNDHNK